MRLGRPTRRAWLLAAASVPVMGAAACLPGAAPESDGAGKRRGPVTLRLWGGPYAAQREDQVAAWNEAHPETRVQFESVPDVGQGAAALRRLTAAVAARSAPDLLDFDRFQIPSFANWRALRPLDDLMARDRLALEGFLPAALDEATGVDGKRYGLPSSADTRLLFWHKPAFAAAGLDAERPPQTWEQLREAAVRLSGRGGGGSAALDRLGFHTEEGQAQLHLFAWQCGGAFQSADGRRATLGLPENQQALTWLKELMEAQSGWAAARALRDRWRSAPRHPFLTGELAMLYQIPDWIGGVVGRQQPDLAFGVAPPPVRRDGDNPMSWSGGYGYVIARETPAPAAVWSVVRWLVGEEAVRLAAGGERKRAAASGGVYLVGSVAQPALDAALRREHRTGVATFDATLDAAAALLPRSRTRQRSLAAAELWDAVMTAQARAVSGQQSVAEALEEQNAIVQRALDQAWALAGRQVGTPVSSSH